MNTFMDKLWEYAQMTFMGLVMLFGLPILLVLSIIIHPFTREKKGEFVYDPVNNHYEWQP